MLTAVVITKNEQEMISDCLRSLQFAHDIVVVDTGNTDSTNTIAQTFGARITKSSGSDYSQFRNDGLKAVKSEWVLYVDADERVSPELAQEIIREMASSEPAAAYDLPRRNIYLGKHLTHGGWGDDYVTRFFQTKFLQGYKNPLHEQPVFVGGLKKLTQHLVHYSHRDLSTMLNKTLVFTHYEAQLRYKAGHPPVSWWRFLRVMFTEFWLRFVRKSAWADGAEGIIDGLFQVFNTFVIYARLWEMQQGFDENRSRN